MSDQPLSPADRRALLRLYQETWRQLTYPNVQKLSDDQASDVVAEQQRLAAEYAERLPFIPVSRCPYCEKILEYPFDAYGLDGPWWYKSPLAEYPEADACEHFQVLLGAINFRNLVPAEAAVNEEVLPGPSVPFVVPALLELPTMKAVISSFTMPPGYTAYPIAYFAKKRFHGALLHQPWGREAYQVRNAAGQYESWTVATHPWDFNLEPYVNNGVLLWINPGDSTLTLQSQPPCPYVNLPGARQPQKIANGNIELLPPPTGTPLQPFE